MSVTHIAGLRVAIEDRVIQRCAFCGAKLCDSQGVVLPRNLDGSVSEFATWPAERLIRVEPGPPKRFTLLPETQELPEDSCAELA